MGQVTNGVARYKQLEDLPYVKRGKFATALNDLITAPLSTFNDYLKSPNYFYPFERGTSRPNYLNSGVFFRLPREWLNTLTYFNASPKDAGLDATPRKQREVGVSTSGYLAYDAAHAEERIRNYWVTLHKDREGKTVRSIRVLPPMIIGERTLSLLTVRRLVFHEIARDSQARNMLLNLESGLSNVTVSAGDTNVGFHNLQDALKFLAQRPDRLAWVWNVDAPNCLMGEQTNESTALLTLDHSSVDWDYTTLVSIYTPHQHQGTIGDKAVNLGGAWTRLMQTVRAQAAAQHPVERVYCDVSKHTDSVTSLMGLLHATVHQQWPDLDQIANVYGVAEHTEGPA